MPSGRKCGYELRALESRRKGTFGDRVDLFRTIFEFCRRSGHRGYAISSFGVAQKQDDDLLIVENRPKRIFGERLWYHLSQLCYALSIMSTAVRWRADVVIVDSGTTHWAALTPLRLAGIKVVGNLHNTLWPEGYRPKQRRKRIVLATEGWFWRRVASALMSVSPECERQVRELAGRVPPVAVQYRGQFDPRDFSSIPAPPEVRLPFRMIFAGRLEDNKGIFDVVEMARTLNQENPGAYHFDICGGGPAQEELMATVNRLGLTDVVKVHGRLNRHALLKVYAACHVVLVPTRSDFCEGFALVAAEAILCGRPVIASSVVPGAEVLHTATVIAKTNDPRSFAQAIKKLRDDVPFYEQLRAACPALREQFLDGSMSHQSALATIFEAMAKRSS